MRNARLATIAAVITLTAGLLSGCSSSPPAERVAVISPPVVTVPAASAQTQTFHSTIGMTPTEIQGVMHLQSFAGDVCMRGADGTALLSHCVCQQINCNCQSTGNACNP